MALWLPNYLQTKKYSAHQVRLMQLASSLQEGVWTAADMKVTQHAGSANMSVDVASGSAWIQGDTMATQGLYFVYNDATVNVPIDANTSGNPRVDQIICHVYDSVDGAAAQDAAVFEVVKGAPTAGAQITSPTAAGYRSGAASLPATTLRLADVLVANNAASIVTANLVDRRPWARGALGYAGGFGGGDWLTSNGTLSNMSAGQTDVTIELSGVPTLFTASATVSNSLAGAGCLVAGVLNGGELSRAWSTSATAGAVNTVTTQRLYAPGPGRYTFSMFVAPLNGGVMTLYNTNTVTPKVMVQEMLRPSFSSQ